jgi:hypothetical protein
MPIHENHLYERRGNYVIESHIICTKRPGNGNRYTTLIRIEHDADEEPILMKMCQKTFDDFSNATAWQMFYFRKELAKHDNALSGSNQI